MAVDGALVADPPTRSLMARAEPDLAALETLIGYRFADRNLLDLALTHVSASGPARGDSYQRLEFLGDRVLGLAVAHMLYAAFPNAVEGELSRRLADLVRRETCADIAGTWQLQSYVRLGEGERQGGSVKPAILADICESLIGAVFLDGGLTAATRLIEAAFGPQMRTPGRRLRDAKTMLQEWAQARGLRAPAYAEVARTGPDHAPEFTIAVALEGLPSAEAKGASKRLAEQAAAEVFMTRQGIAAT